MPSVLGPSILYDSGLGTSNSAQSRQIDRASSATSHTSFNSSNADDDLKATRVAQILPSPQAQPYLQY